MTSLAPRCVVVGTGSIGMRHLRSIRDQSAATIFAFPLRQGRARELEAQGFEAIGSWEEARERGVTHAVIATATGRHASDATAALIAGCHVLVEKPLAADVASACAAAQAAADQARGLWVACCLRFQPALQQFVARLPTIGEVHSVRIECQSYLPDWRPARPYRESYSASAGEGGVLRDLIHEIDYAGWLFGWPTSLQATVRNTGRLGIAADDAADLNWETSTGAAVSLRLDYLTRPPRRQMRAAGERGTLVWDGIANAIELALHDQPLARETAAAANDTMYLSQARAFLSATSAQFDHRLATGADGIRALAICEAARAASDQRREHTVQYR